jgi:hypothetical protein
MTGMPPANFSGICHRCHKPFTTYSRPSRPDPQYCSEECRDFTGITRHHPGRSALEIAQEIRARRAEGIAVKVLVYEYGYSTARVYQLLKIARPPIEQTAIDDN